MSDERPIPLRPFLGRMTDEQVKAIWRSTVPDGDHLPPPLTLASFMRFTANGTGKRHLRIVEDDDPNAA